MTVITPTDRVHHRLGYERTTVVTTHNEYMNERNQAYGYKFVSNRCDELSMVRVQAVTCAAVRTLRFQRTCRELISGERHLDESTGTEPNSIGFRFLLISSFISKSSVRHQK